MENNAQNTSTPCAIFRDVLLFQSPFHQISPSKVSECALQDSWVFLLIPIALIGVHKKGASAALEGGCFVLKASVAISESLYCYLVGILCIITPCHCSRYSKRFQTHYPLVSVLRETQSITDYRIRRHFKQSFDPSSSPQFTQ